ncbi:MAG: DUF481 domain-containing protein [Candidatus Omnitrophota bacterium]
MNCKHSLYVILNLAICLILFSQENLYADFQKNYVEVYLKNGDRISGNIVSEDDAQVILDNIIGTVSIKKEYIMSLSSDKETKSPEVNKEKPKSWPRKLSIGYNKSAGNTRNTNLFMGLDANRKTEADEFTLKGNMFYSSSNRKMDTQKWDGMARYAYSFWERKWYNFYKFESDHDRSANIDYRLIPSVGIGYWFSDAPEWKLLLETGIGLEYTNFRDDTKDSNEAVLIPRAFFEKRVFTNSKFSQGLTFYPSLAESKGYRLHSETSLTNLISEKLSLRFSLIDAYDSNPVKSTKKNDTRLISSLDYSF